VLPLRALVPFAVIIAGCGPEPSPAECNALLDRYLEKLLASDRPGLSAGEILKLQGEARARAAADRTFAECSKRVSRRAYDCAMQAETVDRMEICLN
jgi:hypothetical protein